MIWNSLLKLLGILFPFIKLWCSNRKIRKRIRVYEERMIRDPDFNSEYMIKFKTLTMEQAKPFFDKTENIRKNYVDKAKTSVLGVTVAVSFIVGVSKFLFDVKNQMSNLPIISILIIIFVALTLFYMIFAGIISIIALDTEKRYDVTSDDLIYLTNLDKDTKTREEVLINARNNELNEFHNLILNNYVSSSYIHIRNSLVCLFALNIFICLGCFLTNISPQPQNKTDLLISNQNSILNKGTNNLQDISNCMEKVSNKLDIIENDLNKISSSTKDISSANNKEQTKK